MPKPWSVESREAYKSWYERARPSEDVEMAVCGYLYDWHAGPPPATEVSGPNKKALGPHGVEVWFREFPAGPGDSLAGYLYVMAITGP